MTSPVPLRALLTVRFDVDQISPQLNYKLDRLLENSNGVVVPPEPQEGVYAGCLYFYRGEQVLLRVVATGTADFTGFDVVECCMVTEPQIIQCGPTVPTVYSAPSMFVKEAGAVYVVKGHYSSSTEPLTDGRHMVIRDWDGQAKVTSEDGRWELSFYLTVRISRAGVRDELRVFSFDPETQVGDAVNPG